MSTIEHPRRATATLTWRPSLGAWPETGGTRFRVWSPSAGRVEVVVEGQNGSSRGEALSHGEGGYFSGFVDGVKAGDRYRFLVDDRGPFPDPASRFQPEGVHGPSEVVDPDSFEWTDGPWTGLDPNRVVVYELHVGTFSLEGTFDGVRERLGYLRDLGVTAIELLPLADFAGSRSWGYDGVDLFAPSHNYGRPDDLRRLVDAAHAVGIGVVLDVVYNHFGPVGNYALAFSPHYLSSTHSSAWAACVNLDGEGSEAVREFFIENALHWVHEYHLDGLRLDATHALMDESPRHIVAELTDRVRASAESSGRRVWVVAEDHRNMAAMLRPPLDGGWGLDGVWADDLHHELRRHLAGDDEAYFRDFTGSSADIAETINAGWFFRGQYSEHLEEHRGTDPEGLPPRKFVVCLQNHDQVGNRAMGDRLHHVIDLAAYRAASVLLLSLQQTPMLFMGQEWSAGTPFPYFTDHDRELGEVVTEGRRREFRHFKAFADQAARQKIPDPQDPATFANGRLDWSEPIREPHASVLRLYQAMLRLRADEPALVSGGNHGDKALAIGDSTILLRRVAEDGPTLWVAAMFRGEGTFDLRPYLGACGGCWEVALGTEDPSFCVDPKPPTIDLGGEAPVVTFARPGAVVLRRRPDR